MLSRKRNELICDFAETYHIFDLFQLPARQAARLAAGLRANARVNMTGKYPEEIYLLARISDQLSLLLWRPTEDGMRGINKPKMLTDVLLGKEQVSAYAAVSASADFEAAWARRTAKGGQDG